nr:hypothetical protein [Pelobium sp.]
MQFRNFRLILTSVFLFISCVQAESQRKNESKTLAYHESDKGSIAKVISKLNGVNFVAPPRAIDNSWTNDLQKSNIGWVALVPYAFSRPNLPEVNYEPDRQYWGESVEGVKTNVKQAHQAGLKVMIKPQVWMQRGWIGDFDLNTEEDWKIWEADYEKYMMHFVKIAAEDNVEMICLGTEYRNAVKKRPQFWIKLAADIRKVYKGKLTYCANWDDYTDVKFWKSLDYIGISGYFPLSDAQTPSVASLEKAWKPYKEQLKIYSQKQERPILFTEFGYRSMDQAAWRSWELEYQERPVNNQAQANAYEALFKTFWKEDWFAGGFAWKWYPTFRRIDPKNNHDWTPQNKPAEQIIKTYYSK